MNRKKFLQNSLYTSSLLILPSLLSSQEKIMTQDELRINIQAAKNLAEMAILLKRLEADEKRIQIQGGWGAGKVFSHCAQSIDYSITGFPEMKSAIFQGTVGSLAFSVFSLRGKMSHGLEEPIPGAAALDNQITIVQGLKDLSLAIGKFQEQKSENLKPHFAYGNLNKNDYDQAHTLHIKNHFDRITLT